MSNAFQTVIFDVDSTLCSIEGIDELARMKGVQDRIIPLTQKAMEGKKSLESVFSHRLEIIQPTKEDIGKLGNMYVDSLSPHVSEVIVELQRRGIEVLIVSGGYKEAFSQLADILQIPRKNVHANSLYFDNEGRYKDFERNISLWREKGKAAVINTLNVKRKSLLIGDGMSDWEARESVDLFIGYGGIIKRPAIQRQSPYYIEDIRDMLKIIDEF